LDSPLEKGALERIIFAAYDCHLSFYPRRFENRTIFFIIAKTTNSEPHTVIQEDLTCHMFTKQSYTMEIRKQSKLQIINTMKNLKILPS